MSATPNATWLTPSARGSPGRDFQSPVHSINSSFPPHGSATYPMSSDTSCGITEPSSGAISDVAPASTSRSCTAYTSRTWRQISQTPTSPQPWPAGTGGGPSPSRTCTSLIRPGPTGVAVGIREHRDARTTRRACRERLGPGHLAGVVEEDVREARPGRRRRFPRPCRRRRLPRGRRRRRGRCSYDARLLR